MWFVAWNWAEKDGTMNAWVGGRFVFNDLRAWFMGDGD